MNNKGKKIFKNCLVRGNWLLTALLSVILIVGFNDSACANEDLSTTQHQQYEALVKRLKYNPDDIQAGDTLRELCRQRNVVPICIDAFNDLASLHPKNKYIRYHAALAYIDEVPGHSLFKKGWYSTRSMNHMNAVLDQDPNDWSAFYIRGLNGIYWPISFKRLGRAISDLQQCIALSEKMPDGLKQPYHLLAYIALGDAFVKNGELGKAREIYRRGLRLMKSAKLKHRLSLDDSVLRDFIKEVRDADKPVDTYISFLVDGGKNKL